MQANAHWLALSVNSTIYRALTSPSYSACSNRLEYRAAMVLDEAEEPFDLMLFEFDAAAVIGLIMCHRC